MSLKYEHIQANQDDIKPWSMLTLTEQLNVICDELANGAVLRFLSDTSQDGQGMQLPYMSGFKNQLMCAGVTVKLFDSFFLPTPECVILCLDKGLW